MDAACKGETFPVISFLLIWCSTSVSSILRGLCLFIFVGFTVLTSTVRKREGERVFLFSAFGMMLLSGDLLEVTSRIEPIDFFSAAPVALI